MTSQVADHPKVFLKASGGRWEITIPTFSRYVGDTSDIGYSIREDL